MRQVLQSVAILLQSARGITKCDDYYKVRQYSDQPCISSEITNVPDSDIKDLDLDLACSLHPLPPSSQQATLSKWSCIF